MRSAIPFLTMALVAGCATAPVPEPQLAAAEAAIRSATAAGADRLPGAAKYLGYARQEIAEAQQLLQADDNDRARLLLMRAEADADVAANLARGAAVAAEARRTQRRAEALIRSIPPTPPAPASQGAIP